MKRQRVRTWIPALAWAWSCTVFAAPKCIDYKSDVKPILREKCYICHGPGQQNHGLRLDQKTSARAAVTPDVYGDAELVRRITSTVTNLRMPPQMAAFPLSPNEIDTLVSWIHQGAPWPEETASPPVAVRQFFAAIDQGNFSAIRRMLVDRNLVNTRDSGLSTPLMHAALNADPSVVQLLLKNGADPNATDAAGATALIWAAGDRSKVRYLLAARANVNAKTKEGTTALIAAAAFPDSAAVISELLAAGADPNASNSEGATALSQASSTGNLESMNLLLAHGADPHLVPGGLSPLSAAAYFGNLKGVRLLLEKGVGANERDGYGASALHAAAVVGRIRIAALLIEHGADTNLQGDKPLPSGQQLGTPLVMSAYTQGDSAMARLLIAHGADVNAVAPDGDTALKRAQSGGTSKLVEVLTNAGAKNDGRGQTARSPRDTALGSAAGNCLPEIRTAVEKSLDLLQRSNQEFVRKCGCVSCHNQSLPAMALALARQRGFRFDENKARQESETAWLALSAQRERALQMMFVGGPVGLGYAFMELAATGRPAGMTTAAYVRNLAAQQLPSGEWHPAGARPPQEFSDITATALAVRSLQLYASQASGWKRDYRKQIRRAHAWLLSVEPHSTEDSAFQLFGLSWTSARQTVLRQHAQNLLSQQRDDGGWGQLATLPSDAYATGQALYALHQAGALAASDPAYRIGVEFLRRTQLRDGSWLIRSRTLKVQPHFEGGFPHGANQFISAAGTSWAAMALMLTSEASQAPNQVVRVH